MKYGITVSTTPTEKRPATFANGNVLQHLPSIKALGYHGVDLFIKPMSKSEISSLQFSLKENSLEVSVIFPIVLLEYGMFLSDFDNDKRLEAVQLYKSQIKLAHSLGANIVLGLERGNTIPNENHQKFQERLFRSLSELEEYAYIKNVEILMEPINRYLINNFNRVDECLEFLEKYNLRSIKLLLDTFHMNIEERSILDSIRLVGSRIGHVHAVDNNRSVPGDGHLDFTSIISTLVEVGYDCYLSVETQPTAYPYEYAKRGIRVLKKIVEDVLQK